MKLKFYAFTLAEGATHVVHWNNSRKIAFTLAEVLITLGIIGVVAALTIPTLMANHRRQVAETRLEKFYTTINQAVKMAEVDYGDMTQWEPRENKYEKDYQNIGSCSVTEYDTYNGNSCICRRNRGQQ